MLMRWKMERKGKADERGAGGREGLIAVVMTSPGWVASAREELQMAQKTERRRRVVINNSLVYTGRGLTLSNAGHQAISVVGPFYVLTVETIELQPPPQTSG